MALTVVEEDPFDLEGGVIASSQPPGGSLVHCIEDNSGGTKAVKLSIPTPFFSVTVVDMTALLYFTQADCEAETNAFLVDASSGPVTLPLAGVALWVDPNTFTGAVLTSHAQLRPEQTTAQTTTLS